STDITDGAFPSFQSSKLSCSHCAKRDNCPWLKSFDDLIEICTTVFDGFSFIWRSFQPIPRWSTPQNISNPKLISHPPRSADCLLKSPPPGGPRPQWHPRYFPAPPRPLRHNQHPEAPSALNLRKLTPHLTPVLIQRTPDTTFDLTNQHTLVPLIGRF